MIVENAPVAPPVTASDAVAEHTHRWRIAEQDGAKSNGLCDCGVENSFQNGWQGGNGFRVGRGDWSPRNAARFGSSR